MGCILVTLACFITSTNWTPPDRWVIKGISHHYSSAEVTLTKELCKDDVLRVPQGCGPEPLSSSSNIISNGTLRLNENSGVDTSR